MLSKAFFYLEYCCSLLFRLKNRLRSETCFGRLVSCSRVLLESVPRLASLAVAGLDVYLMLCRSCAELLGFRALRCLTL